MKVWVAAAALAGMFSCPPVLGAAWGRKGPNLIRSRSSCLINPGSTSVALVKETPEIMGFAGNRS